MSKITWSKFVLHHLVPQWEAKGWRKTKCLEKTNHGYWSVLMEWTGEGEPK